MYCFVKQVVLIYSTLIYLLFYYYWQYTPRTQDLGKNAKHKCLLEGFVNTLPMRDHVERKEIMIEG